ncbi:MaoC/PaaZ C-terminal domain-containing protein [Rhodovibrionaceae bacterium A322]
MTEQHDDLPAVGSLLTREKVFTQADFDLFAEISGDNNPIHVDPDFSARTAFGRTVSHGMLLYSCLWGLLREHFPGARQMSQDLMFPAPTYCDEQLNIQLEVLGYPAAGRCELSVSVVKQDGGEKTLTGKTVIEWDLIPSGAAA